MVKKWYEGRGASLETAVDCFERNVRKAGIDVALAEGSGYKVTITDKSKNVLGKATSTDYDTAFKEALSNAGIEEFNKRKYSVMVGAQYAEKKAEVPKTEPAAVAKGTPSGAAPYVRNTSNITDLF